MRQSHLCVCVVLQCTCVVAETKVEHLACNLTKFGVRIQHCSTQANITLLRNLARNMFAPVNLAFLAKLAVRVQVNYKIKLNSQGKSNL